MVLGPRSRSAPAVLAFTLGDRQVVDRGVPAAHETRSVELPVLVAVGAEPVVRVIVPLVSEAHRNAALPVRPDFLDQAIVELAGPLAPQELDDGRTAAEEFGAVAPLRILAVGEGHTLWITAVPGILGRAYL